LGIDICQAFNGEIVSADAIQMYRGLDVATAKVPYLERCGIAHHLISFLPPRAAMTVRDFRALATAAIDDVISRGKLPVVVGGTGYYIQALLKESLLEEDEESIEKESVEHSVTHPSIEVPGEGGHARLSLVDPIMAQRLHPNDTRRIARALHVFDTTGLPYSTLLARQAERLSALSHLKGASKDQHRVYWLSVDDRVVHDQRLDTRVEGMVKGGLLEEIHSLRETLGGYLIKGKAEESSEVGDELRKPPPPPPDEPSSLTLRLLMAHTAGPRGNRVQGGGEVGTASIKPSELSSYSGLLQAIGYKEFEEYLQVVESEAGRAGEGTEMSAIKNGALTAGIERLKVVTHAYARKQDRWIRNRFEKRGVPLIKLDTSGVGVVGGISWEDAIAAPVLADVGAWFKGGEGGLLPPTKMHKDLKLGASGESPLASSSSAPNDLDSIKVWGGQKICAPCGGRIINGARAWAEHEASRAHKKNILKSRERTATEGLVNSET